MEEQLRRSHLANPHFRYIRTIICTPSIRSTVHLGDVVFQVAEGAEAVRGSEKGRGDDGLTFS